MVKTKTLGIATVEILEMQLLPETIKICFDYISTCQNELTLYHLIGTVNGHIFRYRELQEKY